MTAKHVLTEGALQYQRRSQSHAPSSLREFLPPSKIRPSINPASLKIFWAGAAHAKMLDMLHLEYAESLDLALCVVAPQTEQTASFTPVAVPLDISVPGIGDIINLVALCDLNLKHIDLAEELPMIEIHRRTSVRTGVVTGTYPQGHRHYRWPCFTSSIPVAGGMSGGFVYLPTDGRPIVACGVVSADASSETAYADNRICGESIIACTWPSLGLKLPECIPSTPETKTYTLYEMMHTGTVPRAAGSLEKISVLTPQDGDIRVWRND